LVTWADLMRIAFATRGEGRGRGEGKVRREIIFV
jgi:hypothetical protein